MKASVKWIDNVTFLAESESGHTVVIDGPASAGGRNIGIRPMELVLLGVAGCTSFDVVSILQKARQNISDCVAEIEAERADEVPSVFTKIHFHFVVTGNNLKESQVKRAIDLSAEKYCSASIMLGRAGVEISHDYEIHSA
ncbi:MAG: putative redox protein [Patiriisocius sp.]